MPSHERTIHSHATAKRTYTPEYTRTYMLTANPDIFHATVTVGDQTNPPQIFLHPAPAKITEKIKAQLRIAATLTLHNVYAPNKPPAPVPIYVYEQHSTPPDPPLLIIQGHAS